MLHPAACLATLGLPSAEASLHHSCWLASGKAATASPDGHAALQPLAYMGLHISLTAATFAVCKIWWMSSRAHTAFLLCVLCVSAWNGESCLGSISVDVLFTTGLPGEGGRCMLVSINTGELLQDGCMLREPLRTLQFAWWPHVPCRGRIPSQALPMLELVCWGVEARCVSVRRRTSS